jgi:hypothetical protein
MSTQQTEQKQQNRPISKKNGKLLIDFSNVDDLFLTTYGK